MDDTILRVENLCKSFNGIPALENVSFSVRRGEIHGLMGENGAGKSTLVKLLTGIYSKDSGQIIFDGKPCNFSGSLDAQKAGISTIYQELNMIPELSVGENIFLGRYPRNAAGIDWKTMHRHAQELVDSFDIPIDSRSILRTHGIAKQQMIAIIRAISLKARLLVMDEPTSSLDSHEVNLLFNVMDRLKTEGISMIFISHRLSEVYAKCDHLTVLKDGRLEGNYPIGEISELELIRKMVGKTKPGVDQGRNRRRFIPEKPLLELRSVSRKPYVRGISLSLYEGEVLGLAGLLGAGRTELARMIFGCDAMDEGEILIDGKKVSIDTPKDALEHHIAFCTENRREEGIFPLMSVKNNLVVCSLDHYSKRLMLNRSSLTSMSERMVAQLRVKTPSQEQLIRNLSGGNQQKVLLARWMATKPRLIILDEPTRGIDVGAKAEVESIIRELSESGVSILYISSEIPELVRNCDRVLVLREGQLGGELVGDAISERAIMNLIASKRVEEAV